jgi:hypothetical protein
MWRFSRHQLSKKAEQDRKARCVALENRKIAGLTPVLVFREYKLSSPSLATLSRNNIGGTPGYFCCSAFMYFGLGSSGPT